MVSLYDFVDEAFSVDDVLKSEKTENGTINIQLGDAISSTVRSNNAEMWSPCGLTSLPPTVFEDNVKDAPQAFSVVRADRDIILGFRDIKNQDRYGTQFGPGDTCIYAAGPTNEGQPRCLLKGDTGAISLITRSDNSPDGTIFGLNIVPSANTIDLRNSKGYGIIANDDGVYLIAGNSTVKVEPGGIKIISGGSLQIDGTSIVLGSVAAPGVNSVCAGLTGATAVGSTKVLVEV